MADWASHATSISPGSEPAVAVELAGASAALAVADVSISCCAPSVSSQWRRTWKSYSVPATSPVTVRPVSSCTCGPLSSPSGTSNHATPDQLPVRSLRRYWNFACEVVARVCRIQVRLILPGNVPPAALKPAGASSGVALAAARFVK